MDEFNDNEIARLLRLKRYEQPPPGYFENFLHEFHRRQRDELLRQPLWRICLERAHNFMLQLDMRSLASYPTAVAALLVCAAIYLIKGLSATRDGSRRHSESANFIGTGEYRARMEPCVSGRHADFQDAAGSQFS